MRDPQLSWDQMRVFLSVARAGSLRGAAEALSVNHATVARAVAGLETAFGTRLFDRSRSGLRLTQPGEDLVATAERMEEAAHAGSRLLRGHDARPAGPVRVSVPPILADRFLMPHLAAFSRACPEITLHLEVTNQFRDLQRLESDVSIRLAFEVEQDVVGRRLIRYRNGVYASPGYLAQHPGLTDGDGAGATWIGWGEAASDPAWIAESPFPHAGLSHAFPEAVLHQEAAAAGMGLTMLPCFIGDPDPRLARVPGAEPVEDRSIWLLLHSDLRHAARVRAFVDFMAEAILTERRAIRGLGPEA